MDDYDEEDFTSDTLEVTNGSEYNDIYAVLSCGVSDELDDEIAETIIAKSPCLQDSDSDSDSDSETCDGTDPAAHAEAKVHVLNLQGYVT